MEHARCGMSGPMSGGRDGGPPPARVTVLALDAASRPDAARWAQRLGLPLGEAGDDRGDIALEVGGDGLSLRLSDGPRVRVAPGRILAQRSGGRDLLLRAVGSVAPGASVVDATAGLGADAWRLAAHGLRVTMIERVPAIAALLHDALARARSGVEGAEAKAAAARMTLLEGDAAVLLRGLKPAPAVIVLDPMYPRTGKRAKPKKGMALFRALVGEDADAPALLAVAREVAGSRVVVKRPRRAAPLGGAEGSPSGRVVGTTTRYDLYAPRGRCP